MTINYVFGDATKPIGDGPNIIAHVCNDVGAWGAGFTRSLSARYPRAEQIYRALQPSQMELGMVHVAEIEDGGLCVAHMFAQRGLIGYDRRPLRYDALGECLSKLGKFATKGGYSVHMPRIGCGLAGGDWMYVEKLVFDAFCQRHVPVTVYDFTPET